MARKRVRSKPEVQYKSVWNKANVLVIQNRSKFDIAMSNDCPLFTKA